MAYGIVHHFPGGTKEQYEAALAVVHPDGGRTLPEGQVYHAAGPSEGGWAVVAIFDSEESWERFRNDTLTPSLGAGIDGGLTGPPEEITFPVHNHQIAEVTAPAA